MGYIWALTKGREEGKYFAVLTKIKWQLIFYDSISIIKYYVHWLAS